MTKANVRLSAIPLVRPRMAISASISIAPIQTPLRAKGIAFEGPRTATYGMKQLCFHDPDGYQLCFQTRA
jgi:hypothetical protein